MTDTAQHRTPEQGTGEDLSWLLARFRDDVPGVEVAELATTDGMPRAVAGLDDRDSAERLAAVASSLHSLGMGIGPARGRARSLLTQAFFETADDRVFVMHAGDRTLLTVVATLEADANRIGHEMAVLVQSVRPHLATPARDTPAAAAGGEQ